ncbi:hypothetical protein BBJ28_00025307 [Nothophytophthora sp. Chile5]|nr:hypothetical protein BBJ28_00025307 [Nothophytophthora sp. Chile5]
MKGLALMLLPLLLLALKVMSSYGAKSSVSLSVGNSYLTFSFAITQRCFSLAPCYDNKASFATWQFLKKDTKIVFYLENECQGKSVTGSGTRRGSLKFADTQGFDQRVSSFMVWKDKTGRAINGFMDICYGWERATVSSFNASDGNETISYDSSSGSEASDSAEAGVVASTTLF